jgi:hypothetical protein
MFWGILGLQDQAWNEAHYCTSSLWAVLVRVNFEIHNDPELESITGPDKRGCSGNTALQADWTGTVFLHRSFLCFSCLICPPQKKKPSLSLPNIFDFSRKERNIVGKVDVMQHRATLSSQAKRASGYRSKLMY